MRNSKADRVLRHIPVLALAHFLISCSNVSPTSQQGIQLCKNNQTNLDPAISAQQRHALYRRCLATIDSERRRNSEVQHQVERKPRIAVQSMASQSPYASASEIFRFCSFNRSQIEDLYRIYNYKNGGLARISYLDPQSKTEISRLSGDVASVRQELENLVKVKYRGGMPLLPDAAKLLIRCNQQEILALVGN